MEFVKNIFVKATATNNLKGHRLKETNKMGQIRSFTKAPNLVNERRRRVRRQARFILTIKFIFYAIAISTLLIIYITVNVLIEAEVVDPLSPMGLLGYIAGALACFVFQQILTDQFGFGLRTAVGERFVMAPKIGDISEQVCERLLAFNAISWQPDYSGKF